MKTVGIIGGLGPETTTKFYMDIIFAYAKITGHRPNMLISNVAVPLIIEREIITQSKNTEKILPFLIDSAKQLEQGGADFLVIPCNTIHIFIEEIRNSVQTPVLSIVDETIHFLKEKKVKKIGLLATTATINNKLFNKLLEINKIEIEIPNRLNQAKIANIIHHLVDNMSTKDDEKEFLRIVNAFETPDILLACTDLQLLQPNVKGLNMHDTMQILANATIKEMLAA